MRMGGKYPFSALLSDNNEKLDSYWVLFITCSLAILLPFFLFNFFCCYYFAVLKSETMDYHDQSPFVSGLPLGSFVYCESFDGDARVCSGDGVWIPMLEKVGVVKMAELSIRLHSMHGKKCKKESRNFNNLRKSFGQDTISTAMFANYS